MPDEPQHVLDLTRRERIVVIALVGVLLVTIAVSRTLHSIRSSDRPTVCESEEPDEYRIDLNTADKAELCWLPGIGESLSAEIIRYREAHEPFTNVDDLANVPNIGEALVDSIREYVVVSEANDGD